MKTVRLLVLFTLTVAPFVRAQIPAFRSGGYTTLTLHGDISNGFVPPAPPSHVRVPPYENVRLQVPEGWNSPIQWTKNGKALAGATERALTLSAITSDQSGFYNITGAPFPSIATGVVLEVVPAGHLANLSTRLEIAAGDSTEITGFVVSGTSAKNLLVRAVGPTLSTMGVKKPAAKPRLKFFDSSGKEIGFVHPAVLVDIPAFFASIGAFPLTGGETSYDYGSFAPGVYSVHVSDDSRQGGTVLVEVYDFADGPQPYVTSVIEDPGPLPTPPQG